MYEETDTETEPGTPVLRGWKTYLAAVAAIAAGILGVANGEYIAGAQGIIGGLALIGVRSAITKVIEALLIRPSGSR